MKRYFSNQLGLVVVTLFQWGCGDDSMEGTLPEQPVLADVQKLVFDKACSTQGCHDVSAAGQLDLSDEETSRDSLLDIPATNTAARARGYIRVEPGLLETSFLYQKVTVPGLGEGAPMPIEGALTEPYIQLIERWIAQGAR
ncbi:MAG: hypothetical protein VYA30_09575 [Myxococcota bacterium]|nr:hypothetical protein [Myxococcota bacterium]